MASDTSERRIHEAFRIGIILKGLHALIEIVGGLLLAIISTDAIVHVVAVITRYDPIGDADDFLTNRLFASAQHLTAGSKSFAAWYLLSHGVVKLFLVIALFRKKLWAYPAFIAVLGLFVVYQIYRFTFTHSTWLIALSVFDAIVMWLVWKEYAAVKRRLAATPDVHQTKR